MTHTLTQSSLKGISGPEPKIIGYRPTAPPCILGPATTSLSQKKVPFSLFARRAGGELRVVHVVIDRVGQRAHRHRIEGVSNACRSAGLRQWSRSVTPLINRLSSTSMETMPTAVSGGTANPARAMNQR